uniref:Uncharacterized protein n=1 Tax=Hemiselmis andersenii TaxID=464988 RepID=A0A6U4M738_HEMAN
MPKYAIVTTTIYVPKALDAYMENAVEYGHQDCLFVVSGDKKTPAEAQPFLAEAAKKHGVECIYQTPDDQIAWLERFPELAEEIPWNSIQRRNIAILTAYEKGAEVIITIDDDNFFVPGQDFVGDHCDPILKGVHAHEQLTSNTKWLNVCSFLTDKNKVEYYPRGYPMDERFRPDPPFYKSSTASRRVLVNAGLWLDDPDVDAITRLCNSISAVEYTRETSFAMAKGTWCPFNSQNTAISRELIPAYCLSPRVGRYDDIWASYLCLAIMDHFNDAVMFGYPIVKQERNPHNYFKDHMAERHGLEFTQTFCRWLRAIKLKGTTYLECLSEVLDGVEAACGASDAAHEFKDFVAGFVKSNRVWAVTLKKMGAK